ncbi:MAG TPA: HAD domain-containing protein [Burkholderiaceae bacterium]|nr:HAD domain-containing protein [Burkholderiaceae bacterium]
MIVFLDFDGVLHPDPCRDEQLFEHAPRLTRALEEFPEASVVLSTSWRTFLKFEQLVEPLDADLQRRVIGVTPRFAEFAAKRELVPYRRQAECVHWLSQNGMNDAAWIALDDRPSWFEPYCENLVACDALVGFDDEVAGRLRTGLLRARRRMTITLDEIL